MALTPPDLSWSFLLSSGSIRKVLSKAIGISLSSSPVIFFTALGLATNFLRHLGEQRS